MNNFTPGGGSDDQKPSVYEWFEQQEGRASERSRRLTFLMLFNENGRPKVWLVLVAVLAAVVACTVFIQL
jgi:hypothetical protein